MVLDSLTVAAFVLLCVYKLTSYIIISINGDVMNQSHHC